MLMDRDVAFNLYALKIYNRDRGRAYSFIQRKIGEYRLEAEKQRGFIRSHIHHQANILERKLNDAISGDA